MKNILMYSLAVALAVIILPCVCQAEFEVLNRWTVYQVDEPDHVNFAYLAKSGQDRLFLGFNTGIHPDDETWNVIRSDDWGQTWESMVPSMGVTTFLDLPGTAPAVAGNFYNWKLSDPVNTIQGWIQYGYYNVDITRKFRANITFPFDPDSFHFHRSMIQLEDNSLLATGGGVRIGSSYSECMVVKSVDFGKSWQYLSSPVVKESWMLGADGPGEPVMVQLENGNLLLVARNGDIGPPVTQPEADVPMVYTLSTDNGVTWTAPQSLGHPGVGPDMVVLPDGRVVLSFGRPNVYIMVSDQSGTNWSTLITIYEGAGSGYTGMRLDDNGDILLAYNESDFGSGQFGLYPGTVNYMKMVKIAVDGPCGGQFYPEADINEDCSVNLVDFARVADSWME